MRITRGFRGMAETGSRMNLHVTAALSLLLLVSTATAQYSGGTGEPNDPYQIATAADLMTLGETLADYDKHFILTADIDLSDHPMSVDHCISSFSGVFDGNGHTISNFTWIGQSRHVGLFVQSQDPNMVIRGLGLIDPNVQSPKACTAGGLVGVLGAGTVRDCYVLGGKIVGVNVVGGLVGCCHSAGKIVGCYSTAVVSTTSLGSAGGLVGGNCGEISDSYSTSTVVSGSSDIGGLVGINSASRVGDDLVSARIVNCYSGGVVQGGTVVGGLVGYNDSSLIADCYSAADVTGSSVVGGLVGMQRGSGAIIRSYAVGRVAGDENAGGLVGLARVDEGNTVVASFWDMETTGQVTSNGGTGKTTAEMQIARTFLEAGWDFVDETANGTDDIWWIDEGQDYPRLWWEPRPPVRLPVIELDGTTFDAQIAHGVVLVDFFAIWCSHCVTQAPILEDVADRLEGRAQVAKLDIDKSRGIVLRYGVTAVPTLILFREGVEVTRFVGVTSADVLVAAVLAAGSSE